MRKSIIRAFAVILTVAMTLALTACGGAAPTPAPTAAPDNGPEPAGQGQTAYENGGLKLSVPEEFADLVTVDVSDHPLFSVTEIASREAAKNRDPDNYAGAGWLFAVSRVSEAELHEMLCRDMSGQKVIARDDSGNVYILNTPTDVRLDREGEITQEDVDQWSALTGWAYAAGDLFAEENGLTSCSYGNSELDMLLARIAFGGEKDFSLTGLAHGTVADGSGLSASYAEQILAAGGFVYDDRTEPPDGEYLIRNCTEDTSFRFYYGEGGQIVQAQRGENDGFFYHTALDVNVTQIVEQWYDALASAPVPDQVQAAADKVLAEYSALTQEALDNFVEADHPELPWYTAVIANPVRNSLYYGWYDFDLNGVPELVIAAGDDTYQQPMGLYAFDGEKMVCLCKDHPLGERAFLAYFRDGLFATQGSGGAAVGSITLWRIAPDGWSTQIVDVVDYEYTDENTVIYTPQLGNVSAEDFDSSEYLTGFNVPIEYTLFAERNS